MLRRGLLVLAWLLSTHAVQAADRPLSSKEMAERAVAVSHGVTAAEETAHAADARADRVWADFLPRLQLRGGYARLSNFTPPSFLSLSIDSSIEPVRFPMVLEQWSAQASAVVPISDDLTKTRDRYAAASEQAEAAGLDARAARARAAFEARSAYYLLLRARAAVTVAEQALTVAKAHLRDATSQQGVGAASKADVLRAETAVASAELGVVRAARDARVEERRVRLALRLRDDAAKLALAETLDAPRPPIGKSLPALIQEARAARVELRSFDRNVAAARSIARAEAAGRFPALSLFGEVTYANPNLRRFPMTAEWFPTWSAGAQLTWSLEEFLAAGSASAEARARGAALEAEKGAAGDRIELEVTEAYEDVLVADAAVASTKRQLESASEAYRVARQLFVGGRTSGTALLDAESALTSTRFEHLDAELEARLARARLDHALGRDAY